MRPDKVGVPDGVDLTEVASRVRYEGSGEHKRFVSAAGMPRADATKCDPDLHGDYSELTRWLQAAIRDGRVSQRWLGGFPNHVWVKQAGRHYAARLVNREQGTYKGWEIDPDLELPVGLS